MFGYVTIQTIDTARQGRQRWDHPSGWEWVDCAMDWITRRRAWTFMKYLRESNPRMLPDPVRASLIERFIDSACSL